MSFECQYCKKSFKKEKTLSVHLCEPKRRWLNKDAKYVRLGHIAYNQFYKLTQGIKTKEKSYEEFSKSNYYTAFTKFGRHILDINAIDPEKFIDFVINNSVHLDKWCSDAVYETYIRELNKKETAERAVERGILLMQQWSREYDRPYNAFFREISKPRLIHWIKSGRISPWIIFNCYSCSEAMANFNEHELNLINEYLEPTFWTKKFSVRKDDVQFVSEVLERAGL
ncbi:hypothetical protein N9I00_00855 [bacterium]|nr:hypothetical protein [bacterium]